MRALSYFSQHMHIYWKFGLILISHVISAWAEIDYSWIANDWREYILDIYPKWDTIGPDSVPPHQWYKCHDLDFDGMHKSRSKKQRKDLERLDIWDNGGINSTTIQNLSDHLKRRFAGSDDTFEFNAFDNSTLKDQGYENTLEPRFPPECKVVYCTLDGLELLLCDQRSREDNERHPRMISLRKSAVDSIVGELSGFLRADELWYEAYKSKKSGNRRTGIGERPCERRGIKDPLGKEMTNKYVRLRSGWSVDGWEVRVQIGQCRSKQVGPNFWKLYPYGTK